MRTDARPYVSLYTYRVSRLADDAEYAATCAEFASSSWLAASQRKGAAGAPSCPSAHGPSWKQ